MTKSCFSSPSEDTSDEKGTELTQVNPEKKEEMEKKKEETEDKPKKEPAKDSTFRWICMAVYHFVAIPLLIVCIVVLAAF